MCLNAVLRNRLHNNTWSTYVQHKGRVQQAKLLNFLNSFYFSACRFYFTLVLDPHPNTPDPLLILTGSYLVHVGSEIFAPGPVFIHTMSYFIHTGSEFTKLLPTIPEISNIIASWPFVRKLFAPGLKTQRQSQVTDWFRKNEKVTGLNISKRMNVSPFFIKAKS